MIQQALEADLEIRAKEAAPVAEVGVAICSVKGVKNAQARWFNPAAYQLYVLQAKREIPPAAAREWIALAEEGLLQSWVGGCVDLDKIQAAASG